MDLFSIEKASTRVKVDKNSFKLEKDIQALVEQNVDTLFDLEFVSTEFTVGEFRLDTLAFDNASSSFVIIEYKKGSSYSVVDQGYSYLSAMLNNKAEFILEYNEVTKSTLKRSTVDWSSSKVLLVSPSFNSYGNPPINILQIVGLAGSGNLRDGDESQEELRDYLSTVEPEKLIEYAKFCLDNAFTDSGFVLQDVVNEIGRRLEFIVENGRYRGVRNENGFDGIWTSRWSESYVVETKTTSAYTIELGTN